MSGCPPSSGGCRVRIRRSSWPQRRAFVEPRHAHAALLKRDATPAGERGRTFWKRRFYEVESINSAPPVRWASKLLRRVKTLVFLQEALAQVEDGRRPKANEDRRLTPACGVERKRDQDRDECSSDVDSLATVHVVYLLLGVLDCLYPAAKLANLERTASLLRRRPAFGERFFYWIG